MAENVLNWTSDNKFWGELYNTLFSGRQNVFLTIHVNFSNFVKICSQNFENQFTSKMCAKHF